MRSPPLSPPSSGRYVSAVSGKLLERISRVCEIIYDRNNARENSRDYSQTVKSL